ncbi:hypothetical protein Aperf_G00000073698 [Anoplocephala perfoliata]
MPLDVKIYFAFFILPLVFGSDFSPNYLLYGQREGLLLNSFSPSVVCLKNQPWFEWFQRAFECYAISINGTTPNAFPLHVFIAVDEYDLRSRSPWLQDFPFDLTPSSNWMPINALGSDFYEIFQDSSVELYGFNPHCVAFIKPPGQTYSDYQDSISVEFTATIDYHRFVRLFVGLFLYFIAPTISNKIGLYYASGMGISVIGGLLILIFIALRLLPKRTTLLFQGALLLGSGAFSILVLYLQYLRSILWNFVVNHAHLVLGYVLLTALLSGVVLYWFSLPERLLEAFPRTQTLFRFCLRSAGVILISSAPQLPSELLLLTYLIQKIVHYINLWLNIDVSVVLTLSSLIVRALFTAIVVLACHRLSSRRKVKQQRLSPPSRWNNYHLPDLPCATSSPFGATNGPRQRWKSPGFDRFYCSPCTTNYGGYGYSPDDYDDFEDQESNEHTDSYWDGNGFVFSPAQQRHRRGTSGDIALMSSMQNQPSSRRNRSHIGWISKEDEVVTDDED